MSVVDGLGSRVYDTKLLAFRFSYIVWLLSVWCCIHNLTVSYGGANQACRLRIRTSAATHRRPPMPPRLGDAQRAQGRVKVCLNLLPPITWILHRIILPPLTSHPSPPPSSPQKQLSTPHPPPPPF